MALNLLAERRKPSGEWPVNDAKPAGWRPSATKTQSKVSAVGHGNTERLKMSNNETNIGNVTAGAFFGALAGGGLGLGACMFLFDDPPFFTGDTILIGAIACGLLGFFLGAGFIEWLKENWWGFWW